MNCIKKAKDDIEADYNRQAFFEYLDDSPEVKNPYDPKQCADLREYFDYDPNYPDDDRICGEVLDLQVSEQCGL